MPARRHVRTRTGRLFALRLRQCGQGEDGTVGRTAGCVSVLSLRRVLFSHEAIKLFSIFGFTHLVQERVKLSAFFIKLAFAIFVKGLIASSTEPLPTPAVPFPAAVAASKV